MAEEEVHRAELLSDHRSWNREFIKSSHSLSHSPHVSVYISHSPGGLSLSQPLSLSLSVSLSNSTLKYAPRAIHLTQRSINNS